MQAFPRRFALIVALQVALILGLLGARQLTLRTGQSVLLRVEPIDPVDFFRGEYVVLSYSISEVQSSWLAGPPLQKGETVYMPLERSGRFVEPGAPSRTRPTDSFAFLKGTVTSADKTHCRVAYGIESWFVPRGKGPELEREGRRNDRQLIAEVRVDTQGHAVLKAVTVEPKRPTPKR
ncbi:GDYXXLXY domain-containing protein [Armatimonas rosea]|uniref:Putative membrane-anchored protein n=1 Tax=Armatimonas rosea TaxID=685828 RepID=A0A7W9SQ52_ARMRO|nr:GDYXXLXY domain-containing protein [Armatimonas rosea]MBB6050138.1 putative membrane-anchored protein [Armatimonas rosea]